MKKAAFLFPGQGSQAIGMGQDLYEEYPHVRELFEMTDEIATANITKLCFKGPMEDLTQTINLQPAITAVNLAGLSAIEQEGFTATFSAGHSLGEYSALAAAKIISKEDAVRIVFKRGELMHREAIQYDGAMHAIIGLPIETVDEFVSQIRPEGVVSVANHNAEQQIVITGAPDPVEKVSALAKENGARAIPLRVSGAWHSELMKGAEEEFIRFLDLFPFNEPQSAVIHNVTADTAGEPGDIRPLMARQLYSPVRWFDSMQRLVDNEVEIFAEIGPGKVLTGLLKKILPQDYPCNIYNINSLKALEDFFKEVS